MPVGSFGTIDIGDSTTSTGDASVCIGLQNIARAFSVAIGKETVAGTRATVIGYRSSSGSQTDSCVYGHDNVSSGTSADIFGVNRTNSQTNTLLLGNGSYTNIRSNVGCALGTALLPFNNIYSDSQLIGTVNSRLVNDIVSNTSIRTLNNLCSFVSDKIIKDSTIPAAQITTNSFNIAANTSNIAANTTNITTLHTKSNWNSWKYKFEWNSSTTWRYCCYHSKLD